MPRARSSAKNNSSANLGFESKLCLAADNFYFSLFTFHFALTTRRLAVMNLALRGIEADFGPEHADTFRRDLHPDLRVDYVLANPPFNDSDTAPRGSALSQTRTNWQVVCEAQDNSTEALTWMHASWATLTARRAVRFLISQMSG